MNSKKPTEHELFSAYEAEIDKIDRLKSLYTQKEDYNKSIEHTKGLIQNIDVEINMLECSVTVGGFSDILRKYIEKDD